MGGTTSLTGPDLAAGVELSEVPQDGMLVGHAQGESVLLVRRGDTLHAVSGTCPHYGAPLGDGLVVGREVRCPWHHARFDVRTGEVVGSPAINPLGCYEVIREGSRARVGPKRPAPGPRRLGEGVRPGSVVIVGSGPAGLVAAETLRHEGYDGPLTLVSAEEGPPVDRPNLSKDYLAGSAPEEWIPLRGDDFFREQRIQVRAGTRVDRVDPLARVVHLAGGERLPYGALLLATGAWPLRLDIPGAQASHVHTLRTHADSRSIIAGAKGARRAVVIGTSFIGLEVAAALRTRGLEVDVVGPEHLPLGRVLGEELGRFVHRLHEEKGVRFHLGRRPAAIEAEAVVLDDGTRLAAPLVVMGVGVRPNTTLAEGAGCRVERGVVVNDFLETSMPGIWAAGDVARWPSGAAHRTARIEHWAVAGQLGRVAARNMLGAREPFRAVPFFWSQHYDVPIAYVGHGEGWQTTEVVGSVGGRDCLVAYRREGRIVAVASIYRDRDSLLAEDALARGDTEALERLVRPGG